MDDISAKISEILSDPSALEQIKSISDMLGVKKEKKPEKPLPDIGEAASGLLGDDSLKLVTSLAPMLSSIKQEDDTTRLLAALRPFLSDERRKKLDEAKKLLSMMKLLPLVRETGLLDSLF